MASEFQKKLVNAVVNNCDPRVSRDEVLEDTVKYYVAEMLAENVMKNKNRISAGFIQALCGFIVSEFRGAELGEYQKPEKWYADVFNKCIQEILNDAGHAHKGENSAIVDRQRQIDYNKSGWRKRGGLIVPASVAS